MSNANDIRKYCINNYINPARNRGDSTVLIRAGNVHNEMRYLHRHPAICSALRSKKFADMANIECISIVGPKEGVNTTFTFRIKTKW